MSYRTTIGSKHGKVTRLANGTSKIKRANYLGNKKLWKEKTERVKKRDGYCCRKCNRTKKEIHALGGWLETDHIRPVAKGGTDKDSNLWAICSFCHKRRPGHKHLHERQKLRTKTSKPKPTGYRIGDFSD